MLPGVISESAEVGTLKKPEAQPDHRELRCNRCGLSPEPRPGEGVFEGLPCRYNRECHGELSFRPFVPAPPPPPFPGTIRSYADGHKGTPVLINDYSDIVKRIAQERGMKPKDLGNLLKLRRK